MRQVVTGLEADAGRHVSMLGRDVKIAFFVPNFGDGGVERTTLIVADQFVQHGASAELVTFGQWGPFLRQVSDSVKLVDLGARRTVSSLPKLVSYLRRARPTALVSAQSHANVAAVWARALARVPTKLVLSERLAPLAANSHSNGLRARAMPTLMRRSYPKADAIIANSKGTADELATVLGIDRSRITVVYNPVYNEDVLAKAQEPVTHEWFRAGSPVVLAVGRLTPQKDFATLIRAFSLVREQTPSRLVIIGEGPERGALQELACSLGVDGDVELHGFADNPYGYMAGASVLAMSSVYEGLGNVLIEALALGTPVVSTDCSSGPSEVLLDGTAGILTPVGDHRALAAGILRVFEQPDEARRMVDTGQQALDRFRPEACFNTYLELLEIG